MQKKPRVHKNLFAVSESQNHRCACCHEDFPHSLSDYLKKSIYLMRVIYDTNERSYDNSVAVCSYCTGVQTLEGKKWGNIWSLSKYLEEHPRKPSAARVRIASNFETFARLAAEAGQAELIQYITDKMRRHIEQAPPEFLPKIVASMLRSYRPTNTESKYRYSRYPTAIRKRTFEYLFKEQKGLCFYDNHPMHDVYTDRDGPRAATFEHLVCQADGGSDYIENLALACKVCNNLRGNRYMGVEEFREWAQDNPHEIERIAQLSYHKSKRKRRALAVLAD